MNRIAGLLRSMPPEFRFFLSARLFFTLGIRMVSTIVAYQVFHLAREIYDAEEATYIVGIAGLTEFVPAVLVALYAGYYIDTHDKRKIMRNSIFGFFLCAGLLGLISLRLITLSVNAEINAILCVIFATGVIRAFGGPSQGSMIAAIVQKEKLQKAVSLNSSAYLFSSVTGHATGGLLIAFAGISNAYFISAFLIGISVALTFGLKPKPSYVTERESALQSIRGGFAFVISNKTMLGVISLDLFAVLFGGATAFIPYIANEILHTNAIGYGFLNAAMDIGSLLSILILLKFPMKSNQGKKMMYAVAGFGLRIIFFGFAEIYWLSFLTLAAAGICDGISVVIRGTVAQLYTPDHLRGRVSAINSIFINSSNELGQFESGFTSRHMGTIPAVIFGGAMSIVIVCATWARFPNLKKINY